MHHPSGSWIPLRLVLFALLAVAALPVLTSCGGSEGEGSTSGVRHVTFMAGFRPQANLPFVGAYVAQEKGFFREQSLDVDIRHVNGKGGEVRIRYSQLEQLDEICRLLSRPRIAGSGDSN